MEPNYGNTYWEFQFKLDEKILMTHNEIKEGLFPNLKQFTFHSQNGNYIFIPKLTLVIFDVSCLNFREFKSPLPSKDTIFISNYFFDNNLIVVYTYGVFIINLIKDKSQFYNFKHDNCAIDSCSVKNNSLIVEYADMNENKYKTKTIIV